MERKELIALLVEIKYELDSFENISIGTYIKLEEAINYEQSIMDSDTFETSTF